MLAAPVHQIQALLPCNGVVRFVVGGPGYDCTVQGVTATIQSQAGAQGLHGAFGDALAGRAGLRTPGHQLLGHQQVGNEVVVGGKAVHIRRVQVATGQRDRVGGHVGRGHVAPVPNQLEIILRPQRQHLAVEAVQGGGIGRGTGGVERHFRDALNADVGPLNALVQVVERVGDLRVGGLSGVAGDATRAAVEGTGCALHLVGVVGIIHAQAGAVAGIAREHVISANHGAGGTAHAAEGLRVGVQRVGTHVEVVFAGREARGNGQRGGHGQGGPEKDGFHRMGINSCEKGRHAERSRSMTASVVINANATKR